jgi:hypothetical protein
LLQPAGQLFNAAVLQGLQGSVQQAPTCLMSAVCSALGS